MKPILFVVAAASACAADFPSADKLPVRADFPEALTMLDGSRVETAAAWNEKRVPELKALFSHYMYGSRPEARKVTGEVLRTDAAAFGGKATLREVLVNVGLDNPVHLLVLTPNTGKPAPCFLGLNFSGNYALLDDPLIAMPKGWVYEKYAGAPANHAGEAGRGKEKEAWSLEATIGRGYAVATFYNGDLVPDQTALAEPVLAKLAGVTGERGGSDTATIMAWAWGFSRMMDYLQTLPEIDAKRVAVVGHSRNGKTALLAGAFDERFALVIPSQAGCGGTAPNRVAPELGEPPGGGRPKAETVAVINKSFPHWFCGNFKAFNGEPQRLPFDQHLLIALCAPRPVLLSNAVEDVWANPDGQFAMLHGAAPAYALFDRAPVLPRERPPLGELLNERLGYFIRPGKHAMTGADWKVWLDYADKWLK